jgi:hypothetical protein
LQSQGSISAASPHREALLPLFERDSDCGTCSLSSLPIDPVLLLQHLADEARSRVDTLAASRNAQLGVLESDNALAIRRKRLRASHWLLEQHPPGTFILGDSGPIAMLEECPDLENPVRPGTLLAIYLPVSTSVLLVGRPGQFYQTIHPEALNRASAELSRDLFVANRDSARERAISRSTWLSIHSVPAKRTRQGSPRNISPRPVERSSAAWI